MAVRKTAAGARLKRWFKEVENTSGKKDYSGGENTFRPTRRVSKDTPATWSELSASEKARAKEKNTKGRVSRYKKKKKTVARTEVLYCWTSKNMLWQNQQHGKEKRVRTLVEGLTLKGGHL